MELESEPSLRAELVARPEPLEQCDEEMEKLDGLAAVGGDLPPEAVADDHRALAAALEPVRPRVAQEQPPVQDFAVRL